MMIITGRTHRGSDETTKKRTHTKKHYKKRQKGRKQGEKNWDISTKFQKLYRVKGFTICEVWEKV